MTCTPRVPSSCRTIESRTRSSESAWAWYKNGTINPPPVPNMASVGGGVRFYFPWNVYLDVEAAQTLNAVPGSDNGKQATKVLMDASVRF